MQSAVLHAPQKLIMEERPVPEPGKDEVLVKVKAAGICGSDVHFFEGTHPYRNYPRIHGHELSGVVVETTAGVTNVNVGDPVVVEPLISCGNCYPCRMGKYNCCTNLKVIGAHVDGGFAEYLKVPARLVHKTPMEMPFDLAATCEPYSIGYHACQRAGINDKDQVLILGAGAIGLTVLDFAQNAGAQVYMSEISPVRRNIAEEFGARVINPDAQNLLQVVQELTGGEGFGVVVEATGNSRVMEGTAELVAAGGRIVLAGLTNEQLCFQGINFTKREMTLMGTRNSAGEFPGVIEAIASGKTHADRLITKKFPFTEMIDAMRYAAANMAGEGKVIIEFD